MEEQQVLIFLFLNDNHLSNVKTLQSIYRQDYSNIYLIACNDCTEEFQCERFLYNFEAGRGENIKGIYFHENEYPIGELQSKKILLPKVKDANYVMILHSGEYFVSNNVLTKCVKSFQGDEGIDVISMNVELWSDDMKKCISKKSAFKQNTCQDCGVVYRKSVLEELLIEFECDAYVSMDWVPNLMRNGNIIKQESFSGCKYSQASIKNVQTLVAKFNDSYKVQTIRNLLVNKKKEIFGV